MIIVIKMNMKNLKHDEGVFYLSNICDLKRVKGDNHSLILFGVELDEYGVISEYKYFLEEVIISVPIKEILTNIDSDKLREICSFHNLKLYYI